MSTRNIPQEIPHGEFLALVEPLLTRLGVAATDIDHCEFDADGVTLNLFELDEEGQKFLRDGSAARRRVFVRYAR